MEKRLLEKLLFDKRRELELYDKQLEEYMRLSTLRAASGSVPLIPGSRTSWTVSSLGSGSVSAAALAAPRAPVPSAVDGGVPSQKEVLQKLLAEKQAELEAASAEADAWAAEQAASANAAAQAQAASLSLGDRVRSLEEILAVELARKEEQIALNEELVRINEDQMRANQELLRKLQASQALATAAASAAAGEEVAVPAAASSTASSVTYKFAEAGAKAPAPAPAAAPAKDDEMVLVQEDDGTQVLYRKLGRVLERPGGLGVVALGLVSSIPSAVAGAVNSIGSAAQKSETLRISRKQ